MHRESIAGLLALALALPADPQTRASGQTLASGGPLIPEQAAYDVLRYELALRVEPRRKSIAGRLEMTARLLDDCDEIVLDLDDRFEVSSTGLIALGQDRGVQSGRRKPSGGRLRIGLNAPGIARGAEFIVTVVYSGRPQEAQNPPWDGGFTWAQTEDGQPWIATSCQGEGADLWWPCKDHPSDEPDSLGLRVAVPRPLVVAGNGRLVGVRQGGLEPEFLAPTETDEQDWRTFHWEVSTPINNYGVALQVAPYETITTDYESVTGESFPFTYWVLPENVEQGRSVFAEFQRQMRFLEEVCGPYPFRADKYGVAETPHLGMEHQTIIAYGHGYRGDPELGFDYDWLHHHELSHEWWANLVTARDWKDFWIHEGLGTYMQALYLERRFGPEAYRKKMLHDLQRVENRGAVAPREPRTTQEMYFAADREDAPDIDIYVKGAWICHTLRWLLGDETFFTVLRRWAYPDPALEATTDGSACRLTDTEELVAIAERHAGRELGWFFELYLRQPELPRLKARKPGRELRLEWETPGDLPFPMPVEVEVGGRRVRLEVPAGGARLEVGREPWSVDPDAWLLMARG